MPGPNQTGSAQQYRGIRISKLMMNRGESTRFKIGDQEIEFKTNLGINIDSDDPNHTSRDLYDKGHKALNILFERERTNWLSAKVAEMEAQRIAGELTPAVQISSETVETVEEISDDPPAPALREDECAF